MATEVHYELDDGIAVVTLERPVANALSASLRAALADSLARAFDDADVKAVILCGAGTVFSSGVDIAEYDDTLATPWISDLGRMIETAPKPVIAALHGAALGAGFELALAAHARVVQRGTRLALPEVTLGLVPGGGGTQRLPRLVGAQAALEIMLSGKAFEPEDPRVARIFARIVDEAPVAAAKSAARQLIGLDMIPRTCDMDRGFSDPEGYQRAVSAVAERLGRKDSAEAAITRCVEAAQLLPFERGLEFERTVF